MQSFRLHRLSLRNFRGFAALDVALHPGVTLISGPAGSGKTAVLDALALALGPYVGAFDEATGRSFTAADLPRFPTRPLGPELGPALAPGAARSKASQNTSVQAEGVIPSCKEAQTWRRTLVAGKKVRTVTRGAAGVIDYALGQQEAVRTAGVEAALPLVRYHDAAAPRPRQCAHGVREPIQRTSRMVGYTGSLEPGAGFGLFEKWFFYWSFNARDLHLRAQDRANPRAGADQRAYWEFAEYLVAVGAAVDTCLGPLGWRGLAYSFERDALVLHHPRRGAVALDEAPDGVRNLAFVAADLAFRATKLNGGYGAMAARRAHGIVLVDNLDACVPAACVLPMVRAFTLAFPGVQFVFAGRQLRDAANLGEDAGCAMPLLSVHAL